MTTIISSNPKLVTQDKGDFAFLKIATDLKQKGYLVFKELASEALPFDLIAYKDGKYLKIQCKYSKDYTCKLKRNRINSKGYKQLTYSSCDIDFFALYSLEKDVVCYVPVLLGNIKISFRVLYETDFWFFKDFLSPKLEHKKKKHSDIENNDENKKIIEESFLEYQKILKERSNRAKKLAFSKKKRAILNLTDSEKENLKHKILNIPMYILCKEYGVSDNGLKKYCQRNNIYCPSAKERRAKYLTLRTSA